MKMEEWKEYELSELIDEISMGPFGSNIKVECFTDSGVPVLNGSNLVGLKLNEDKFNYVTEEKATSLGKANAYRNDIVITHRGTLGQIIYIPQNSKYDHYVISQSQFRVRCNQKVLPEYLVYYFHTRIGQHQLLSNASQVGVPALARPTTTFQKLRVVLPPLPTQQKIAAILSSLDDKIELNNKINTNLEQQAQALFKKAFADKIDNVSDKDGKTLGSLIDIVDNRGKTPPSSNEKNDFPILDVGALNSTGRIIDYKNCTKYVDEQTYSTFFRDGHPQENDILLSTVGSLAQMKFFKGNKGCIAQNVVAFRTLNTSPFYLYEYLKYIKNDLLAYDIGSVQPSIKVTHIIKHLIYIPTNDELSKFDSFAKCITEQIYNNFCENERLISIRDTLLPKLMNGEIETNSNIVSKE